jgi:peptidoglycan/xylan/chitin deacetylase (PgdA/CDA1 family)
MTDAVLSVLEEEGVKATFFLIGSKIKEQEQLVRRIVEGGHIVANHSWRHNGTFPLASAKKVGQELDWTVAEIERVTGKKPKLFRPPFGVTNPIIGRVSQSKGLVTIGWNVRSLDTVSSTPRKNVLQRIMNGIVPGSVILLHDRCEGADALLRDLIAELNKADYKIVPLDKLLDIQAYEN